MIKSTCNTDFNFPLNLLEEYLNNVETRPQAIEDLTFMRLYIYKAMRALTNREELVEYCGQEFVDMLRNIQYNDTIHYDKSTLKKDKFLELIYYYKGLKYL